MDARGRPLQEGGGEPETDGTAHPHWLSRIVKGLSRPSWPRDGGIDGPSRIGGGEGGAGGHMPGSLRPGIMWHFHEMPIRLSRMSHARRPVSKEAGRSGVDGGFETGLFPVPAIDASFL